MNEDPEYYYEELRGWEEREDVESWRKEGCCYPGECLMPELHSTDECHTAHMLEESYPCEKSCTICEGEPHHWIEGFLEFDDETPMLICKHCSTSVPMPSYWDQNAEEN